MDDLREGLTQLKAEVATIHDELRQLRSLQLTILRLVLVGACAFIGKTALPFLG